jgi:hypothetical protein
VYYCSDVISVLKRATAARRGPGDAVPADASVCDARTAMRDMRCAVVDERTFAMCMPSIYGDGNKGGQPIVDTRIEQVIDFTRLFEAVQARTGSRGQE